MLVLGVDPGFRHLGICLVRLNGRPEVLYHGTEDVGSTVDWRNGITRALRKLLTVCAEPDIIAVEELKWHGVRRGVLALAHLAGGIAGLFLGRDKRVFFFSPKEVKQATRAGRFPQGFTPHEKDALSLCRLALATENDTQEKVNGKLADPPPPSRGVGRRRKPRRS